MGVLDQLFGVSFVDPHPQETERQVRDAPIQDGRNARRLGFPINRCPRFKIKDWAIDWRNGWRWEDESIKARAARGQT